MKGFALPRQFRKASLEEALSRNMRELVSFLNSFVVRFESDGTTLLLPGDVTVSGDTTVAGLTADTLTLDGNSIGVWSPYTPTWSASSAPSIGNGTLAGSYTRIGNIIHARIRLVAGSTTTYGSGTWTFTLPVDADTDYALIGSWLAHDSSDGNRQYTGASVLTAAGTFRGEQQGVSGGALRNVLPFTWANGDDLSVHLTYKAA